MSIAKNILFTLLILVALVASYAAFWILVLIIVGGVIYLVLSVVNEDPLESKD